MEFRRRIPNPRVISTSLPRQDNFPTHLPQSLTVLTFYHTFELWRLDTELNIQHMVFECAFKATHETLNEM